ncbi:MAG: hypothetical protein ACOYD9_04050 [Pyramidobacter sp.]|jgi:hypothetical protein
MKKAFIGAAACVVLLSVQPAEATTFKKVMEFDINEANQAVCVDEENFYAIDNRVIAKYEKRTGRLIDKWEGPKDGQIKHLDSGMVMNGKIYCAHSNYPEWPMTSSVEVWDTATMKHVATHSFGIHWGSLTWLDWHDGSWWSAFANYEKPYGPNKSPYGYKARTTIVKFDKNWQWQEAWVLPQEILERLGDMSNSGGSWGADGYLYLSGHDNKEVYKCKIPQMGSVVELMEIIPLDIRGQGIAWDRSEAKNLYGIIRATKAEKAAGKTHKVTVSVIED